MAKAIEEQLRDAEQAAEAPLEIDKDEIKAAQSLGVESMEVVETLSAGQVYIYDTRTGDRSVCNRNNLLHNLRKKRPDGSLVFSTERPRDENGKIIVPAQGFHKCLLHPDERKPLYDTWGLATCRKDNLANPYQVRRHMEKRHKQEWRAIQEEEQREDRERRRKLDEALIKSASKK